MTFLHFAFSVATFFNVAMQPPVDECTCIPNSSHQTYGANFPTCLTSISQTIIVTQIGECDEDGCGPAKPCKFNGQVCFGFNNPPCTIVDIKLNGSFINTIFPSGDFCVVTPVSVGCEGTSVLTYFVDGNLVEKQTFSCGACDAAGS